MKKGDYSISFLYYKKVMGRGRRYDGERKLNMKKVVAVGLAIATLIIVIVLMVKYPTLHKGGEGKNVANSYLVACSDNKWGVINSKGEIIIDTIYENMIVIPDPSKAIFICQEDVDLENGTYKSYAMDASSSKLFTSYDQVEAMQNVDSMGNVFYDTSVLKVQRDGKYGLINFSGKELLSPDYTSITPLKNVTKSFVTEKDGKYGLVDNSGSVIIENNYTEIVALTNRYEDGFIVKDSNNQYGLINYNRKQILDCKYTEIMHVYGSEMYVVKEGNDIELVSADGLIKLKNGFTEAVSIDNSNVIVKADGKYGVISSTGEKLINQEYQDLKYAFEGNYIAKKDDKYGIINLQGETPVNFNYNYISYSSEEGFIEAEKDNGEMDLINTTFEVKTSGILSEINSNLGYIKVRKDGEYKYYNFKLEEKKVQDVLSSNTLFLSKYNNKYGFVDKNGIVVVDYTYDDATEQNDYGFSAVKKDGKWGVIDATGKVIVEPSLELSQNTVISFISKWHLAPDLNANYYTDSKE